MTVRRGEIWWASLAAPRGSEPGLRRPVLVVQSEAFNRSRIPTVVVAVVTSSLHLGDAPGNVRISRRESRLPHESVVNVSQLLTLDREFLEGKVGRLPAATMSDVESGLRLVLGLPAIP